MFLYENAVCLTLMHKIKHVLFKYIKLIDYMDFVDRIISINFAKNRNTNRYDAVKH